MSPHPDVSRVDTSSNDCPLGEHRAAAPANPQSAYADTETKLSNNRANIFFKILTPEVSGATRAAGLGPLDRAVSHRCHCWMMPGCEQPHGAAR
jgi:hypothetical protein